MGGILLRFLLCWVWDFGAHFTRLRDSAVGPKRRRYVMDGGGDHAIDLKLNLTYQCCIVAGLKFKSIKWFSFFFFLFLRPHQVVKILFFYPLNCNQFILFFHLLLREQ